MAKCCSDCCQGPQLQPIVSCPVCGARGEIVKNYTVRHMVTDKYHSKLVEADYWICVSRDCPVVYFETDTGSVLRQEDVRVPIWFKNGAHPKYACYCSEVTQEQVIEAVIEHGAKTVKEVIEITGAMQKANCREKNPMGVCCTPIIKAAMEGILVYFVSTR